jgi:hypothetical protein
MCQLGRMSRTGFYRHRQIQEAVGYCHLPALMHCSESCYLPPSTAFT